MLLSAVSVLVVAQSSLEIPEGLMNNPVLCSPSRSPSVSPITTYTSRTAGCFVGDRKITVYFHLMLGLKIRGILPPLTHTSDGI